MATDEENRENLRAFEQKYHGDLFEFLISKLPSKENLEILDISIDACTFSAMLAEKLPQNCRLVTAMRKDTVDPCNDKVEKINTDLSLENLSSLGKYDFIVAKEILHEVPDVRLFCEKLKENLKSLETGSIFMIFRPKNPPVPLPMPAMLKWRRVCQTREEIIAAGKGVGYEVDCYTCSIPLKLEKGVWGKLIKGRFLAAVKTEPKCTDKEIKEFIESVKGPIISFEEKIFILHLRPIPGWTPEMNMEPVIVCDDKIKLKIEVKDAPKRQVKTAEEGVQAPENKVNAETGISGIEETPKMMANVETEEFSNELLA